MLLDAFARTMPFLNWAFFIVGIIGAIATAASLIPSINQSLWAKVTTVLLWLLFAREGYDPLAEKGDEDS